VEEFIARENIRRFQAQLKGCTDPEQRAVLMQLIEIEQERLLEVRAAKRPRA
jgi:hypothetical protein